MVKSKSYSPFRYAPWCFRDLQRRVAARVLHVHQVPVELPEERRHGRGVTKLAGVVPDPASKFH